MVRQSSIIKVGQTDLMLLKLSKTMSTAVTLPTNEHCTKFKASGENVVFVARNTKGKATLTWDN